MFQMTFILMAYFDWLLGSQKGQIFEKKNKKTLKSLKFGAPKRTNFRKKSLKIFFSETVCFMKLILCIHVPGISLYKKDDFCSSQIRTLVAMATFRFHRLIMGKVKICYFCSLIFREMFIE